MKTIKLIDSKPMLDAFFNGLFDRTDKRLMAAARHGISEAINKIKSKTEGNISGSWFNATSPMKKYGVPLISGVKAYLYKGEATGFVDILGNRRTNDGTWMLRFFEGGTKLRRSKYGRNYGSIRADYFFGNAIASIGSDAIVEIENSIQSAIDEINHNTN